MANIQGMRDSQSYSDERPGDYRQKIRDYAKKKKPGTSRPSVVGTGFVKKAKFPGTGAVRAGNKTVHDFTNY
jgi:hypothetical protein